jgi:ABC-type antimicrobial peptide transport system permease subunit
LLSLAGIYTVLSFTVARRTREIGVRVALGASRQRIVAAIFRRPLIQEGAGVIAGAFLVGLITTVLSASPDSGSAGLADAARAFTLGQVGQIVAYATLMMGVCLLACIGPTRRALGVEPTEALRAESRHNARQRVASDQRRVSVLGKNQTDPTSRFNRGSR